MDEFPFDETLLVRSEFRIARTLLKRGSMKRRDLQLSAAHREQSGDLFAAALTRLLDRGDVVRADDNLLSFVGTLPVDAPPLSRKSVPSWDRSGRQWRK